MSFELRVLYTHRKKIRFLYHKFYYKNNIHITSFFVKFCRSDCCQCWWLTFIPIISTLYFFIITVNHIFHIFKFIYFILFLFVYLFLIYLFLFFIFYPIFMTFEKHFSTFHAEYGCACEHLNFQFEFKVNIINENSLIPWSSGWKSLVSLLTWISKWLVFVLQFVSVLGVGLDK